MKGQVKFGKVDATVESQLASKFGVSGYPTIKYWEYGEGKKSSNAKAYEGARDSQGLTSLASKLLETANIEPDIFEIYKQEEFDNNCSGSNTICLVNFLPNIYDSDANQRNQYIESIKQAAKKNRSKPIKHFWLQAGDQLDIENQLNLGFGYPATVAISPSKKKAAIMKGSFSAKELSNFMESKLIIFNIRSFLWICFSL
jgi:protein disulfide-isomerase A6